MERFQNLPTELIFKYKFVAKRDVTISQLGSNIFSMLFYGWILPSCSWFACCPERYVAFLRKASDSISRIMTQDLTEQPYLNKLVKPAGDLCRGVFSNLSNI